MARLGNRDVKLNLGTTYLRLMVDLGPQSLDNKDMSDRPNFRELPRLMLIALVK